MRYPISPPCYTNTQTKRWTESDTRLELATFIACVTCLGTFYQATWARFHGLRLIQTCTHRYRRSLTSSWPTEEAFFLSSSTKRTLLRTSCKRRDRKGWSTKKRSRRSTKVLPHSNPIHKSKLSLSTRTYSLATCGDATTKISPSDSSQKTTLMRQTHLKSCEQDGSAIPKSFTATSCPQTAQRILRELINGSSQKSSVT